MARENKKGGIANPNLGGKIDLMIDGLRYGARGAGLAPKKQRRSR